MAQSQPGMQVQSEALRTVQNIRRIVGPADVEQSTSSPLVDDDDPYHTLFESIDEGFCIIEVLFGEDDAPIDYRFLEINRAFEVQTGIENAIGRRMRELAPEHEQHWFDIYGRVAKTGEAVRFEAEANALGRFYDVNAFRVGVPEQRLVAILFKDISARKQSEQQLAESSRRKDEFLATLAHELRNPLAPITSVLALLRRTEDLGRAKELHTIIERQVGHMVRLVDDLLDVSRITRGLLELREQTVDLEQVIQTAVETSRPNIERGHRRLSISTSRQGVFVDGDPTRLVQIVANLLNNAAKFTEENGQIWLTLARAGEHAWLSVRDDGIGIPENMLHEVFDMFAQVEPSHASGLGIGLTLVRSLVELHGGTIEVHSEGLGRGSEFIVLLPLCSAPAATLPDASLALEPNAVTRSCPTLVVDDDPDAANSLAQLLGLMGVEVKVAYDGPTALQLCRSWTPELVLLDLELPGMDGYAIARSLREAPRGHEMEIVAMTGAGQADDRRRAREAGFDQHLVKPALPETLAALLAKPCR